MNVGLYPSWSHDGKELYTARTLLGRHCEQIYAAPVKEVAGALQFGVPQTLVSNKSTPNASYQLSPDDKKILLYRASQQVSDSITVVTNFAAELKK